MRSLDWMQQAACKGRHDPFFEELPNGYGKYSENKVREQIRVVREICVDCPVFAECLRYSVEGFREAPYCFMAGYSERDRYIAWKNNRTLDDWRRRLDLGMSQYAPSLGKRGLPATWSGERVRTRGKVDEVKAKGRAAERPKVVRAVGAVAIDGRRFPLPIEDRPFCPAGHDRRWVQRNGVYRDGTEKWICFDCPLGERSFRDVRVS